MPANRRYAFGEYTLDLGRGALLKVGVDVRLRPKSFEVLRLLIERHGQLVTKEELLHAVWGRVVVTDGAIGQCLIDVRRAIGDESQQMIRTVPRRGYIFDAPVAVAADPAARPDAGEPSPTPPHAQSRVRPLRYAVVGAALVSLVPLAIWWGVASRGTDSVAPIDDAALETPRNAIAVLPFVNMSSDPDNEYLCDGISEEILNRLAAFPDLQVIARTSSFALKDSGFDVPKLSSVLGVRYLLQGSVRRDGNRLRITAQLVDASGVQVWSGAYDRELRGIFEIQREIAEAVATTVVPQIVARPPTAAAAFPDLDAYQHYLIGREVLYKRAPGFWKLAEEQFLRAIAIDPQYAEPHAELALVLALTSGWHSNPDEAARQAERAHEAIERAFALEPNMARAHAAQGLLLMQRHPPDYAASEAALRKALALEHNMVDASNWLSGALKAQGRHAEAFAVMERAARNDPLASPLMGNLADAYAERGDVLRAEESLRRLLELPRPSYYVYWNLMDLYFSTGRLVESHDMAQRLVLSHAESSDPGYWYAFLAKAYSSVGLWAQAEYWLTRHERANREPFYATGFNRAELLRLEGRHEDVAEAVQAMREVASGERLAQAPAADYGTLQALAGDHRGAVRTLAPHFDVGPPGDNNLGFANARHALAWAYLNTGDNDRAHRILRELDRQYRKRQAQGWLHSSADLALFAQNAVLTGEKTFALSRLRQAIDAGWRDYFSVSNDPRWRSLNGDPRFKEVMARVKADIDAQRARVERIEAADDFAARLDRALANRR